MNSSLSPLPQGPKAADGVMTYYAHVSPDNLVTWAVSAMNNSYSPYSGRKEGVLIRTERGDISTGTNVETINYDGLVAIEIAIGRLFAQQPWADHTNAPEKISDIVYALEDFDPQDPDSYVPDGRSLDWLRRFGSPDTVLHFATPDGIAVSKYLRELLPHGPRMKPLAEFFAATAGFSRHLRDHQEIPAQIDARSWHELRRSRLFAFSPYSTYRVGAVIETAPLPLPADVRDDLDARMTQAGMGDAQRAYIMQELYERRQRYQGINVELSGNAALHAEACAIGGMILDHGPQAKIAKLYLQGGFDRGVDDCTSCGKCRQLVSEFSTAATEVVVVSEEEAFPAVLQSQYLPGIFRFEAKLG